MNARTLLLASCLLAFGLGACNTSDDGPESDTTAFPTDSAMILPAPIDTMAIDSSAMMPHDSVSGSDSTTPSGTVSGSATTGSGKSTGSKGTKGTSKPTTGNTTPAPTTPTSVNSQVRGGGSSGSSSNDTGHSYPSRPR